LKPFAGAMSPHSFFAQIAERLQCERDAKLLRRPAGSKCADFPKTIHVNGTAYALSVMLFPTNTKPGTYTITFTGVSGSLSNSTTARFTVK
jgi:hypothetical protein